MTGSLLDAALALHHAGCCVVPARADGSKAPAAYWKQYQHAQPADHEITAWLANGTYDGFGIICGAVSASLEMLEFEGRAVELKLHAAYGNKLADHGFSALWQRIINGYTEVTPGGGLHILFRVDGIPLGNTRLARNTSGEVLIETRGEGGFTIVAPSAGRTHPSGKAWQIAAGGAASIVTISEDERDALYAIATLFDEQPPPPPPAQHPGGGSEQGLRPGDDFNARATWDEILIPHGWRCVRAYGTGQHGWRRPGKEGRGISATSRDDAGFYVFSTSTSFEAETPYSKFGAYALLEHGGDYSAAAARLRRDGYGDQSHGDENLEDLIGGAPGPEDGPGTQADPSPSEPLTELGYARRLIHAYGDQLRYVPAWGRWLIWDGKRWADDTTGQAPRWAKAIARRVTADAIAAGNGITQARRGESAAGIAGALTLAGTEKTVVTTPAALDAHPCLLNCANGTLNLSTGELRPHNPADLLTKITRAAYHPAATGPEFAKFLERVQPDPAMRDYLARVAGHAIEGRVTEHVLPIFYGPGANGKSTFTMAVQDALGDYAAPADPELLIARTFSAHPAGTADLFGLRLAVLGESDQGRRLAEGTVKRLTSSEAVKARRMRENFWSFIPSHTFLMLTNHKPVVSGADEGIWRRLKLIPWNVIIPEEERDPELGERLTAEQDAILVFLVRGYKQWQMIGLSDPEQVTEATTAYRNESDAVTRFIEQRCLTGPHFRVRSAELFSAWTRWCTAEGEDAGTQTAFSVALVNHGYDKKRTKVGFMWEGIGLTGDDSV